MKSTFFYAFSLLALLVFGLGNLSAQDQGGAAQEALEKGRKAAEEAAKAFQQQGTPEKKPTPAKESDNTKPAPKADPDQKRPARNKQNGDKNKPANQGNQEKKPDTNTAKGNDTPSKPAKETAQPAKPKPNQESGKPAEPADPKKMTETPGTAPEGNEARANNVAADSGDASDVTSEDKPDSKDTAATGDEEEKSDDGESAGAAAGSEDGALSGLTTQLRGFLDKVDLESKGNAIEETMGPISHHVGSVVFSGLTPTDPDGEALLKNADGKAEKIPFVLVWLALASLILTFVFFFINIRGIPLAIATIRGKYSSKDDPGEISHFQALTSAISGTVGLGNIAGVAVGIAYGGPGVAFWMLVMGLFGMTTKFAECTLGVKYRRVSSKGKVFGGPMYYLRDGFAERDMKGLGWFLATAFAICCAIAALGAGNMFQVNQSLEQLINVTGGENSFFAPQEGKMIFGIGLLVLVGLVILFGIKGIGKATALLVPLMCIVYVLGCIAVLVKNGGQIGNAINTIWESAWNFKAMGTGGAVMALLWGIRRAAFSNEAGFGSAPIAHAAARTRYPASEGLVALLEPFIDTVIVCSMTALVIVTTGAHEMEGLSGNGIAMTSAAFETVVPWFRYLLAAAAIVFAISTLITWSYYGQQAWGALFGRNLFSIFIYKIIFLFFILVGSVLTLKSVIDFSDGFIFLMAVFNLIGVYALIPVVKRELKRYRAHVKAVKAGKPSPHEQGA